MDKLIIIKRIFIMLSIFIGVNGYGGENKKFSVSAGWLHVMPQGKANPFNINTKVKERTNSTVGTISTQSFLKSVDPNAIGHDLAGEEFNQKELLIEFLNDDLMNSLLTDGNGNILPDVAGSTEIRGLENWQSENTGLEAEDVDTLGLMFNYHVNDNVSLQLIGGIPPKVDIKGKGEILAPLSGLATSPSPLVQILFPDGIDLKQDIPITNLGNKDKAASVRAWTPALEVQYQFGKSGINRFRPYIGAGVMFSRFTGIKLDPQINRDLVAAGHMIQNVLDGNAGAALDGKVSSANPFVRVKTTNAIAPIISIGGTYDLNSNWFTVASISYAKLNNEAQIDVIDANNNQKLITSHTKVNIDPLITYLGIGYRF